MKRLFNYIGQLRIYSLVDLILMLRSVSVVSRPFLGAIFLWVGFLAYQEAVHKDKGRKPVNQIYAWLFWLQALIFLGDGSEVSMLYIIFSILYSMKKKWYWARLSPLIRGLQTIAMLVLVSPTEIKWYWLAIAAFLSALRNFWGDARDTSYDRADTSEQAEGIKTWPVVWEMKDYPFAHLAFTFLTSIAWWAYAADLSLGSLALVLLVEVLTYWLTPRQSNKKAAERLLKILRSVRG